MYSMYNKDIKANWVSKIHIPLSQSEWASLNFLCKREISFFHQLQRTASTIIIIRFHYKFVTFAFNMQLPVAQKEIIIS